LGNTATTLGVFTQFQRRIPYDAYDVTTMLRPGPNTLAALLGNGWCAAWFQTGFYFALEGDDDDDDDDIGSHACSVRFNRGCTLSYSCP
jgi:hypothetical protein